MNVNSFQKQVHQAQQRWKNIQQYAENLSNPSPELQAEVILELSVALEELRVAVEELNQQNQRLSDARQHYQELFEFAPNGYLVTDERGVIQEANEVASTLLKIPKQYLVNKPLDIFIAKTNKKIFESKWSQISEWIVQDSNNNFLESWEMLLQPCNKEPLPVLVSISGTRNTKTKVVRLRWLLQDLSNNKQAEEKIREQAALLDVATDAIIVHNLQDKISFWNKGAERLYGWTKEDTIGKNHKIILSPESSLKLAEIYQNLFKSGQWQGELTQITKAGTEIIVESRWTLVRDDQNNLKSILVVNTDITLAKQLEAQRLHNQRLEILGSLASGISHDLNNILTPILGLAQLLARKFPEIDEHTQQMLKTIEINAQRGANLLKQILMFSRGVKSKYSLVQPSSLISEITQITQETFPKSIAIYQDIPSNLWAIRGDLTQLHQVLMNLCLNARDAMPNGGIIKISATNLFIDEYYASMDSEAEVGSYVVITVSDTGIGIPLKMREQIFEPFFINKEFGKGTGLDLSIVMSIVKNHGGFIKVLSEVGKGTQFKVFLPAKETTPITLQKSLNLPKGNGALILIVDDEVDICNTTKSLLTTYGYQVLTANNGIEAIALYAQHNKAIAAVLIDMVMPSMDGKTTIDTLQKINPEVKIVAISGLYSIEQISETLGNKIQGFLSKPYSSEELLTVLQEVLEL